MPNKEAVSLSQFINDSDVNVEGGDVSEDVIETMEPPTDTPFDFVAPDIDVVREVNHVRSPQEEQVESRKKYMAFLIDSEGMELEKAKAKAYEVYPDITPMNSAMKETIDSAGKSDSVAVVTVDKRDASSLEFTKEERKKLTTAKGIRLISVEDNALSILPRKKTDKSKKKSFLNDLTTKAQTRSVILLNRADYATFRSALAVELATALYSSGDDTFVDTLNRQASFIYDKFEGSTTVDKLNPDTNEKIAYTNWINTFKYNDIDAMLYAIITASHKDEHEVKLKCNDCGNPYTVKYRYSDLYRMAMLPDEHKENAEKIMADKYDRDILQGYADKQQMVYRVKDNDTNIIYDIYNPTIADAMVKGRYFLPEDNQANTVLNFIALHIHAIMIPDEDGEYILYGHDEEYESENEMPWNPEEYAPDEEIMQIISNINQDEYQFLTTLLDRYVIKAPLYIHSQCDKCNREYNNRIDIERLVFTMVQEQKTLTDIDVSSMIKL